MKDGKDIELYSIINYQSSMHNIKPARCQMLGNEVFCQHVICQHIMHLEFGKGRNDCEPKGKERVMFINPFSRQHLYCLLWILFSSKKLLLTAVLTRRLGHPINH